MLNQCVLTGNLGNDPEVNFYGEGQPVANFNLAFNSSKKKTGWIRVTCFNKLAEIAEKYLHKGARIAVVGVLDQKKYEGESGPKTYFQILANNIEFIKTDGRGFEEGQQPEELPF